MDTTSQIDNSHNYPDLRREAEADEIVRRLSQPYNPNQATGIHYHAVKPIYPVTGDFWFDIVNGAGYVYTGYTSGWVQLMGART